MGLVFRKSIKLFKGVNLNLSKSGVGLSVGGRGVRFSVNSKGEGNASLGIPGTGVYYRKRVSLLSAVKDFFGFGNKENANQAEENSNTETLNNQENLVEIKNEDDLKDVLTTLHLTSDEVVDWNKLKDSSDTQAQAIATKVLENDEDAFLQVVEKANPFGDLLSFGSDFEVGIIEDDFMGVSFNILDEEKLPHEISTVLASGKEKSKPMSKTAFNAMMKSYVSSMTFRVARDLFALIPVSKVIVNAQKFAVNPQNGKQEDVTILSVVFDRKTFNELNFQGIDSFEALKNFEHNLSFKTTTGFEPVLPLR